MKRLSCGRLARAAVALLLPLCAAEACGPDFFHDVFVRHNRPDLPAQYVRGRLGLLQTGFARADLFVAYRYLNGGSLNEQEQKGWEPTFSVAEQDYDPERSRLVAKAPQPSAAEMWMTARRQMPDPPKDEVNAEAKFTVQESNGFRYETSYTNCADDAFRTAIATLQARVQAWGASSAALLDWMHGQDAVFADCSGAKLVPGAALKSGPDLLRADRAYQIAAAHFYMQSYADAAAEFLAIAQDRSSPWQPSGGYLAARAMTRQAWFAAPPTGTEAEYDHDKLRAAGVQLRHFLAANPEPRWRRAAEAQLALVRIRTEPVPRARELAALVAGGAAQQHDDNFAQDLQDLLWIVSQRVPDGLRAEPEGYPEVPDAEHPGSTRLPTRAEALQRANLVRQTAFEASSEARSFGPMVDWTVTMQSLAPAAAAHAREQWRSTHALPWLMAALTLTDASAARAGLSDLLQAAAAVPSSSPGWQTAIYHRARLLLAAGDATAARGAVAELSQALQATPDGLREVSTVNAVRGLRLLTAPTAQTFFADLPRSLLLASSEEAASLSSCQEVMQHTPGRHACVGSPRQPQMDADAADALNYQAPLTTWIDAARTPDLPQDLRYAIAAGGWTRAVLLQDAQAEMELRGQLPRPLQMQAAHEAGGLGRWMTLARNPGLRPYVNGGMQRAYSYDFVENFRDNWCYRPDVEETAPTPPAFLTAAEKQRGRDEASRLATLRSLQVGQEIVRRVTAEPSNPDAAEALYLVLRMLRYQCVEAAPAVLDAKYQKASDFTEEQRDLLELKLQVGRLMRRYYAASPWTKKAAPFVG